MLTYPLFIAVAARASPLSRMQVQEVLEALRCHCPEVIFSCTFMETTGDRDLKTSLRQLNKSDFFTKEIDRWQLQGHCRIAIHSAKDLPDPLARGLAIVAITKGIDPSDALVMRQGDTLFTLPSGARIATSSLRREEAIKALRQDFTFIDLRGTIEQRLAKLEKEETDGVVIAQAALIRLKLYHLNRLLLSSETAPLQGKLAIVAREGDQLMKELFAPISS